MFNGKYPINMIFWDRADSTDFLYGSAIDFSLIDRVHFKNSLIASGTVIHKWYSDGSYQANRIEPQLPLLSPNTSYEVFFDYQSRPESALYLKFIFYDFYGGEVRTLNFLDQHFYFSFPENAYSYEVDLVSRGVEEFLFHKIILQRSGHQGDDAKLKDDNDKSFRIFSPVFDQSARSVNIIFQEPYRNLIPYPASRFQDKFVNAYVIGDLRAFGGFYLPDQDDPNYTSELKKAIEEILAQDQIADKKINFIGFGPISDFAAALYSRGLVGNVSEFIKKERPDPLALRVFDQTKTLIKYGSYFQDGFMMKIALKSHQIEILNEK